MDVKIEIPGDDAPGFIQLQCELAEYRTRVKDMDPLHDVKFWDEFTEFAARFIIEPRDAEQKKLAARQLSRAQVNQILDYLQGREPTKPPLPTSPSSTTGGEEKK